MTGNEQIELKDRVIVITGAGRGIGRAAAHAMARAGGAIVINDMDPDAAETVVDEIRASGGRATPCVAAIGTAEAADKCIAAALNKFGRLDVMACNAGILRDRMVWNLSDEDFDAVIHTHLRGTFACGRAAARHFRQSGEGGRLILVSSIAGQRGNLGQTSYAAAKAGIAALARTWAIELAKANVTVNAIVPSAMTAMTNTIPAFAHLADIVARGEPLPNNIRQDFGLGDPDDVAPLFVYLASERSSALTGQCIGIGGDRLSIWSHPAEAAFELHQGGWSLNALAHALEGSLADARQSIGIDFN